MEFIILLCNFLVISFAQYREFIIYIISFGKFSDVLPAVTFAWAIVNLWSFYLGVNILRLEWSETLATRAMQAKFEGIPSTFCCL